MPVGGFTSRLRAGSISGTAESRLGVGVFGRLQYLLDRALLDDGGRDT